MSNHKKIIVANWKMNPRTSSEALKIFEEIKPIALRAKKVQTVICPSFLYLESLRKKFRGNKIALGAQDLFWEKGTGAFTGEISAEQLIASGASYVILGHSERRALGETNEIINKKVSTALKAGLKVLLCIGEENRDREGKHLEFVARELLESLAKIQRRFFQNLTLAYEPVWAISSKEEGPDNPEDAQKISIFLRKVFVEIAGPDLALSTPIIYGGSADPENTPQFLAAGFAGLLVGRESLIPKHFNEILQAADAI